MRSEFKLTRPSLPDKLAVVIAHLNSKCAELQMNYCVVGSFAIALLQDTYYPSCLSCHDLDIFLLATQSQRREFKKNVMSGHKKYFINGLKVDVPNSLNGIVTFNGNWAWGNWGLVRHRMIRDIFTPIKVHTADGQTIPVIHPAVYAILQHLDPNLHPKYFGLRHELTTINLPLSSDLTSLKAFSERVHWWNNLLKL